MFSIIDSLQKTVQQLTSETEANRRKRLEPETKALPDVRMQDCLTQSINSIGGTLENSQLSTLQTLKLQQAKQLLQQVKDSMPLEP